MDVAFKKYHGTGNDFIIIDDTTGRLFATIANIQEVVYKMCHRNFGIGADGLILLQPDDHTDFYMRYYNADGRVGSFCGNGSRCAVAFAHQAKIIKGPHTKFMAFDGLHSAWITSLNDSEYDVRVQLNECSLIKKISINEYFINTGSPHLVIFVDHFDNINVYELGSKIRYSSKWAQEGVNVNFVKILDNDIFAVRTYERGVERETLSCGTGVAAAAIAVWEHQENQYDKTYRIETHGGVLMIKVMPPESDKKVFSEIWLMGPAKYVYNGVYKV